MTESDDGRLSGRSPSYLETSWAVHEAFRRSGPYQWFEEEWGKTNKRVWICPRAPERPAAKRKASPIYFGTPWDYSGSVDTAWSFHLQNFFMTTIGPRFKHVNERRAGSYTLNQWLQGEWWWVERDARIPIAFLHEQEIRSASRT